MNGERMMSGETTTLRKLPEWQQALVETFITIQHTRMQDVPVINSRLQVNADCFVCWQQYFLGVLITPWFMNLMLLPASECSAEQMQQQRIGAKQTHLFPSGPYEFIVGAEPGLGRYQSCSLFSPMFDFADQAAAEDTAAAVLSELMKTGNLEVLDYQEMRNNQEVQDRSADLTSATTDEANTAVPIVDADSTPASLLNRPLSRRQLLLRSDK